MAVAKEVIVYGLQLRSADPVAWDNFITALRTHMGQVTSQMLTCPPESLPRAQGMAIAINELYSELRDAPNKLENLREKQRYGPRDFQPA